MKKILSLAAAALVTAAVVAPVQAEHIFEEALGEVAFGVPKATAAWAADGKKTAGEYYDIEYKPEWISTMCSGATNEQTAAIDVDLAMSWDETYLYTWLSYTDPNGHNFTLAGQPDFWNGDIVQFSGADGDAAGDGMRLEVGFGKYSDTGELGSVNWQDYLGSGFAASGSFPEEDCNIFIEGDVITYEFRIPFEYFVTADAMAVGSQCRVSYCFCWDGEAGGYAVWQLASGISGGKDAGNHALVTLEAAPAAGAAAPAASAGLPAAYPASGTAIPDGSVLIAGNLIGNEAGWDGTEASGRASAFDGNIETFFDPATASVDWCGIDAGEEMILTKIIIHPRTTFLDRFNGATIEASNDPEFEESVELFFSVEQAAEIAFVDCTAEMEESENTGYRYFRYINYMSHGDVAEVELYGKAKDGSNPTYGAEAAAEAPAATEAPAAVREESEPTLDVAKVTAPLTVDGVIDEGYTKLHNFYQVEGFKLDNDPDKSIEGSAYAAWDDDNFYLLLEVVTPKQEGNYSYDVGNIGKGPCGYAAILGKADGTHTDDQRFEIGHGISAEGDQVWKISGPADIKDNYSEQLWYDDAPWKYYTKRDEATKTNFYEFAIPWDFIDRTGLLTYEEGSQIVLTYAANIHTLDEYNAGQSHILEFGGGIWAGAYTDGGTVTLVAAPAPVVEEPAPAPVVEEPAPVEEEPAPVEEPAEEVVEAPAAEVVEAVEEPEEVVEVVEEAPQTFDFGVIAAISALVSLAGVSLTKKR